MKELKEAETVFDDLDEKEEKGLEFDIMTLGNHPGWKAVVKELEEEKKGVEAEIFDINNGLSDEYIRELRIRRYYIDYLINLPKTKKELFERRSKEEDILIEDI